MSRPVCTYQRLLWAIIRAPKPRIETPFRLEPLRLSRHFSNSTTAPVSQGSGFSVYFDEPELKIPATHSRTPKLKTSRKKKPRKTAAETEPVSLSQSFPLDEDNKTRTRTNKDRRTPRQDIKDTEEEPESVVHEQSRSLYGKEEDEPPTSSSTDYGNEAQQLIENKHALEVPRRGKHDKHQRLIGVDHANEMDAEGDAPILAQAQIRTGSTASRIATGQDHDGLEEAEGELSEHLHNHDTVDSQSRTLKPSRPPSSSKPSSPLVTPTEATTPKPTKRKFSEPWQTQKAALASKFGSTGWSPRRKLSPDAIEGIRSLHLQDPDRFTTPLLAEQFKVSPEAIRRILKSKWRPASEEGMQERRERWAKRHDRIWDQQAALGLRPARRSNKEPEGPDEFEEGLRAREILERARSS